MKNPNPAGKTPYIIGDIHGCYQELLLLEEKIYEHAQEKDEDPFFVSVGDLIDRGPDSRKVVEHFLRGEEAGTHWVVAGNHEASFLEILEIYAPQLFEDLGINREEALPIYHDGMKRSYEEIKHRSRLSFDEYCNKMLKSWKVQGGKETLLSYEMDDIEDLRDFPLEHLRFLCNLPIFWEDAFTVVTHAMVCKDELELIRDPENYDGMLGMDAACRGALWNRKMDFEPPDLIRVHVSGHTPIQEPAWMEDVGRALIDTGCVYGNCLTAMHSQTHEFITVEAQNVELDEIG